MLRRVLGTGLILVVVAVVVVWVVGAVLPAEHSVSVTREVAGSPEDVWAVLTAPGDYPAWRTDLSRVEVLSDSPEESWREHASHSAITFRRTVSDPPRRLVVEIADQDLPFGGQWTYDLERGADGTLVTITEDGFVRSPIFRFVSRFIMGQDTTIRAFLESLDARMRSTSEGA